MNTGNPVDGLERWLIFGVLKIVSELIEAILTIKSLDDKAKILFSSLKKLLDDVRDKLESGDGQRNKIVEEWQKLGLVQILIPLICKLTFSKKIEQSVRKFFQSLNKGGINISNADIERIIVNLKGEKPLFDGVPNYQHYLDVIDNISRIPQKQGNLEANGFASGQTRPNRKKGNPSKETPFSRIKNFFLKNKDRPQKNLFTRIFERVKESLFGSKTSRESRGGGAGNLRQVIVGVEGKGKGTVANKVLINQTDNSDNLVVGNGIINRQNRDSGVEKENSDASVVGENNFNTTGRGKTDNDKNELGEDVKNERLTGEAAGINDRLINQNEVLFDLVTQEVEEDKAEERILCGQESDEEDLFPDLGAHGGNATGSRYSRNELMKEPGESPSEPIDECVSPKNSGEPSEPIDECVSPESPKDLSEPTSECISPENPKELSEPTSECISPENPKETGEEVEEPKKEQSQSANEHEISKEQNPQEGQASVSSEDEPKSTEEITGGLAERERKRREAKKASTDPFIGM